MKTKVQSPFDGKPTTIETKDALGRSTYTVILRALTPLRAKIADGASLLVSVAAGVSSVGIAFHLEAPTASEIGLLLASPIPAYWAARLTLYHVMERAVNVVFTPEQFIIERLFGTRRFDRNLPHGFALHPHDRAGREAEKLSYRERQRKHAFPPWPPKRYLGNSYHLSFEYLDQRNDIMTVYRRKHAYRLLARLNAIKRILDTEAKGIEQILTPERDWAAQPGDLSGSFQ